MTKDVKLIAATLRGLRPTGGDSRDTWHQWESTVGRFVYTFLASSAHPNFTSPPFILACGIERDDVGGWDTKAPSFATLCNAAV